MREKRSCPSSRWHYAPGSDGRQSIASASWKRCSCDTSRNASLTTRSSKKSGNGFWCASPGTTGETGDWSPFGNKSRSTLPSFLA